VLASSRRHAGDIATGAKRFQRPSADTWGTVDESDKALIHVEQRCRQRRAIEHVDYGRVMPRSMPRSATNTAFWATRRPSGCLR
jgi:hypothetical protein